MPRRGFPKISSMPSFRLHGEGTSQQNEHIPMRSIETDNLRNLPPTSSPYSKRSTDLLSQAKQWTPISISSGSSESSDEDEKADSCKSKGETTAFMSKNILLVILPSILIRDKN